MTGENITRLLSAWQEGDEQALAALTPIVYEELRRLARRALHGERPGHTLQATALVHEAFLRLVDARVDWQDRAHFYALAARQMRRILTNHAQARRAQKRGGGLTVFSFDEAGDGASEESLDVVDLDEALGELARQDERKSRILELHYFGGLTYAEMAAATGLSESTVHAELRFARAWLKQRLQGQ